MLRFSIDPSVFIVPSCTCSHTTDRMELSTPCRYRTLLMSAGKLCCHYKADHLLKNSSYDIHVASRQFSDFMWKAPTFDTAAPKLYLSQVVWVTFFFWGLFMLLNYSQARDCLVVIDGWLHRAAKNIRSFETRQTYLSANVLHLSVGCN